MKNLRINYSSFLFFSYAFLMLSFFLPLIVNTIALITCGILSLLKFKKLPYHQLWHLPISLFSVLFIWLLIGLSYSDLNTASWGIIERHLPLIFVPFIASSFTLLSQNQRRRVIDIFVFGVTAAAIYFLSSAIQHYLETGSVYIEGKSGHHLYNQFMHHRLTEPLDMHAVYFSLYLSFAFIVILDRFLNNYKNYALWQKMAFILLFIFYALVLILLKSSLFALALPLSILFLLLNHFWDKLLRKSKYFISGLLILVIISGISYYGVQSKIKDFSTDLKLEEKHPGPLKIRLGIWYSSWETIKADWAFGHGTGDGHQALMEKYRELDFYIGKKDQFNAHNMYLQYWISNGVFAVLLYLMILLLLSRRFLLNKQFTAFLTVFLFAAFSFTESTMLRQNGVVFFILFCSIFYFSGLSKSQHHRD